MARVPRPARRIVLGAALVVALVAAGTAIAGSSAFIIGAYFSVGAQATSAYDSAAQRWNGVEWYSKSNNTGSAWARVAFVDSVGNWSCSTTSTAASGSCFLGAWSFQKKGLCRNNGSVDYTMSCRVYYP